MGDPLSLKIWMNKCFLTSYFQISCCEISQPSTISRNRWDEGIAIVNIDVSSEGRQKIQKGEMQTKTMK